MRKFIPWLLMSSIGAVLSHVPVAAVVPTALACPLADRDHCAMSLLYGLREDQWKPLTGEAVALREHTLKLKSGDTTIQGLCVLSDLAERDFQRVDKKGTIIERFKEQVLQELEDNIPEKDGQPDLATAEGQMFGKYQQNIASDTPWYARLPNDLSPENDHWIGSELSARLGLPLIRMTFRSYVLENTDGLQALSLPFVAKVEKAIPVATLWLYPNVLASLYDDDGIEGLCMRSFPALSESGILLLRNVQPVSTRDDPQMSSYSCEWSLLSSGLLECLEDGFPHATCCFLIHSQGIELNVTLLQKQLPYLREASADSAPKGMPSDPSLEDGYVTSLDAEKIRPLSLLQKRLLEIEYMLRTHGDWLRGVDDNYPSHLQRMKDILQRTINEPSAYFAYTDNAVISDRDFRQQWTEKSDKPDDEQTAVIRDLRAVRNILNEVLLSNVLFFDWYQDRDGLSRVIDSDPEFCSRILQYARELGFIRD
jgi:hypothetical protein